MVNPDKKQLLNYSLIALSLSLVLLFFEISNQDVDVVVLLVVGLLALCYFMFNRVLLIAIFIALSFFDFAVEGLTYFKILGYLLLVVLTISVLLKQIHIDLTNRLILLLIAIFLASVAGQLVNGVFMTAILTKLLMVFAMLISISVFITRLDELKFVLWMLTIAGMVAAAITIYEVIANPNIHRIEGSLGNPNNTAAIFCMLLPYSAVLLGRKNKGRALLFAGMAITLLLVAIFVTASRGGILSLSAIAATALFLFKLKGKLVTLSLILFSALLLFALLDNYRELNRYEEILRSDNVLQVKAVRQRLEIASIGLQLFLENPVWGVGAGNFRSETKDMETESLGYLYGGIAPHNMYTQILAELGIIGFFLFMWFYYTIFEHLLFGMRHEHPEIKRVAKILLFSFVAIMVSMATSGNYNKVFIYIIAGFALVLKNLATAHTVSARKPLFESAGFYPAIRRQV
jgi:O-antigen ligase